MSLFDDLPPLSNDKNETNKLKRKAENEIIKPFEKISKLENNFKFKGYLCSKKGERDEMQDAHVIIDDFKEFILKTNQCNTVNNDIDSSGFYGVYDGHNGVLASDYAAANVHKYLAQNFPKGGLQTIETDIKRIIIDVFKSVENDIIKLVTKQRPPLRDGSTAVIVLIINNFLYIAHIGDSKAVLARTREPDQDKNENVFAIPLTRDHCPQDIEERNRIQTAGSFVKDGRVCGMLEVSRSFGDYQYKKMGVIAVPDVKKCRLTPADKFIIIACDGVWKVFTPADAVKYVYDIIDSDVDESLDKRYSIACNRLVTEAIIRMSGDNVTVILVSLQNQKQYNCSSEKIA